MHGETVKLTSHQFTGVPILSLIYPADNLVPVTFRLLLTLKCVIPVVCVKTGKCM